MSAMQDAINVKKFRLVLTLLNKSADNKILQKKNDENQNLFHIFAKFGNEAEADLTKKIVNAFIKKNISISLTDNSNRTPLHYAAESHFYYLIN